jgi:type II secretory pathway component GspD/PulD (secretin)
MRLGPAVLMAVSAFAVTAAAQTPKTAHPVVPVQLGQSMGRTQLAPETPVIVCKDGKISVRALNSTLNDVIRGIANCVDAKVQFDPLLQEQRVVAQIGPAVARDVLTSLLRSQYNYMLVGAQNDPESVAQIVVHPKDAGLGPVATVGVRSTAQDQNEQDEKPGGKKSSLLSYAQRSAAFLEQQQVQQPSAKPDYPQTEGYSATAGEPAPEVTVEGTEAAPE